MPYIPRRRVRRPARGGRRWTAALPMVLCALLLFRFAAAPISGEVLLTRLAENPVFVTALLRAELGLAATAAETADSAFFQQRSDEALSALSPGPAPDAPVPAPEDQDVVPAVPETVIKERTLSAGTGDAWVTAGGVTVYNRAGIDLDLASLLTREADIGWSEEAPQVLIYHTHGTEAYAMTPGDPYQESDPYRTTDTRHNMVRVGDELAAALKANGISVVHDRTLYDYPSYNNSYARSLEGVEALLAEYPSIRVVIDLHRDALEAADGTVYKTVADAGGQTAAQVLLVLGTDAAGQPHPNWQDNLCFALAIQRQLDADWPALARPLTLRSYRYNQQVLPGALLIEVGTHGNSLEEALLSARLLGQSISVVLTEKQSP
ncbi:MAG: stage II sporulation protein P [Oscillospiraceae bacterium]|nr:stage II sporulation protein P [Oscillospiraceae bacterium]